MIRALEERAFNELVTDLLLQQEYKRRGITVTDDEILQAARMAPAVAALLQEETGLDPQLGAFLELCQRYTLAD